MKANFKKKLWDIYSRSYDTASLNSTAYRELQVLLVNRLDLKENEKILNLGCGTGNLEKYSQKDNSRFLWIGVDISQSMLKRAEQKLLNDDRFKFQQTDISISLDFENNTFDKVILVHSLYALENPEYVAKEIFRILKKEGILIVVNPKLGAKISKIFKYEKDRSSTLRFWALLIRTFPASIINMLITVLANKKTYHFMQREEIQNLLLKSGFKIIEYQQVYVDQSILIISKKT